MGELEDRVRIVVCEQLGIDSVRMDSRFIDDLNADSLDVVSLIMAIEDEFDILLPEEDYVGIRTVGEAAQCVSKAMMRKVISPKGGA